MKIKKKSKLNNGQKAHLSRQMREMFIGSSISKVNIDKIVKNALVILEAKHPA